MSLEKRAMVSVNMILFRSKIWITEPRQKFKSFYSCYRIMKWAEVFRQMYRNRWAVACAWCLSLVKVKLKRPFKSLMPFFELNSSKSLECKQEKSKSTVLAGSQPMTSAQKPVQPRSQDLSLGSVWAFIVCPLFATFICSYVMRCLTFSSHFLRGSVPNNGPIDFASKNHFSLNSADGKCLVPKY